MRKIKFRYKGSFPDKDKYSELTICVEESDTKYTCSLKIEYYMVKDDETENITDLEDAKEYCKQYLNPFKLYRLGNVDFLSEEEEIVKNKITKEIIDTLFKDDDDISANSKNNFTRITTPLEYRLRLLKSLDYLKE
jgi:hypothetical protein